ncbi:Major facilitator superfamily [Trinorchestia longiramus]|nr:Major facilitator superfamily [Trinorchestia longiramus]
MSTNAAQFSLVSDYENQEEECHAEPFMSSSSCSSINNSSAQLSDALITKYQEEKLCVNKYKHIPAEDDLKLSSMLCCVENSEPQSIREDSSRRPSPVTVNFESELECLPLQQGGFDTEGTLLKDDLETDVPAEVFDGVSRTLHEDFPAQPRAPDGGWGWAVLIGAFYIVALMINITICFGILFSGRLRDLKISSAEASYVFMLHNVMFNFGILMTNTMVIKYGFRKVSFIGCLTASLSFMALAFADSLAFIIVVYSVLVPVSGGLGSTVSFLIVPLYFERRRGLAMAIMMTGIAAGGIACPLLIRFLQDNYGFFWATLIQGAVILNCCVAAALFRPLQRKKRKQRSSIEVKTDLLDDKNEKDSTNVTSSSESSSGFHILLRKTSDLIQPVIQWMKQNYLVLKKRKVLMIGFSLSTAMVGYFNFLMLVPFAVESTGHTSQFAAQCISASNFSNAGIRLLVSAVADRSWFNRTCCFGIGVFVATLTSLGFVFITQSEAWMMCFMVVFGLGIGLYMSLYHMHMIDVLGMELYSSAMGVNAIIMAATFAMSGPVFGGIRRLTTSYEISLAACSSLLFCSTLLVVQLHTSIRGCKHIPSSDFHDF